jgi:hypothetical protein
MALANVSVDSPIGEIAPPLRHSAQNTEVYLKHAEITIQHPLCGLAYGMQHHIVFRRFALRGCLKVLERTSQSGCDSTSALE